MTDTIEIIQGTAPTITMDLLEDGAAMPVADYTFTAELGLRGQKAVATVANAAIIRPGTTGRIEIPFTTAQITQPGGTYLLELTIDKGGGQVDKLQETIIEIIDEVKTAT